MIFSILYYLFLVVFLLLYGVFISVVWLATVWWDKKRSVIAWTTHYHAMGLFWLCPCWKIEVKGTENIVKGRPYVMVSNHQAMFDIPLLHKLWINRRWVAKKELIKMPFVGHALLVHGDILLERGASSSARSMLRKATLELKKGVSVAIFPEGTRSRDDRVRRFREGAFTLAKLADAEILPIAIDGTGTAFDGWKLITPHTFRITVLPAVPVETVREKAPGELSAAVREEILGEHRKMRPELYEEIKN